MGRRLVAVLAPLVVVLGLGVSACSTKSPAWGSIPVPPSAEEYPVDSATPDPALADIDQRLSSLVNERHLTLVGQRTEHLPSGVDWSTHLSWRKGHAAGLRYAPDRTVPEPDAPVLVAEYQGSGRTLFVIGRADAAGDRLIVLTALARPA